jgi:DNA repair protein RadC
MSADGACVGARAPFDPGAGGAARPGEQARRREEGRGRAALTVGPAETLEGAMRAMNDNGDLDLAEAAARAAASGPGCLTDAECLGLALGGEAGAGAQRLLSVFGSLPEVLGADAAALRREAGVGPRTALHVALLHDLQRRTLLAPLRAREIMSSWSAVADYLRTVLAAEPREQFRVLFLDHRNRLIRDEVLGRGSVDHAPVYPREVLRRALELNASAVVLAHNHPSASPNPSAADIEVTRQVCDAARALRISVHDHLLVAGREVVSFRGLGLLP